MKPVLELFDRLTANLPPMVVQVLRLGALLLWLIGAVVVAYLAWNRGSQSAPARGQDLSLSEIRARVEREQNLRRAGDLHIPDLNELVPEERPYRSPYEHEDQRAVDLAGEDSRLIEAPNPVNQAGRDGPLPFVGENRLSPQSAAPYPPSGRASPPRETDGLLPAGEERRPLPESRAGAQGGAGSAVPESARRALPPSSAPESAPPSGSDDLPFLPE